MRSGLSVVCNGWVCSTSELSKFTDREVSDRCCDARGWGRWVRNGVLLRYYTRRHLRSCKKGFRWRPGADSEDWLCLSTRRTLAGDYSAPARARELPCHLVYTRTAGVASLRRNPALDHALRTRAVKRHTVNVNSEATGTGFRQAAAAGTSSSRRRRVFLSGLRIASSMARISPTGIPVR